VELCLHSFICHVGVVLRHRDSLALFYPQKSLHGAESVEKLIVAQLVKKSPAFYGTRMLSTVFTTVRH
jgi:hypothetical protein